MRSIEEYIRDFLKDKLTEILNEILFSLKVALEKKKYITKEEFKEQFNVGNETIDSMVRNKVLSRTKFDNGRSYYYDITEINEVLNKNKQYF